MAKNELNKSLTADQFSINEKGEVVIRDDEIADLIKVSLAEAGSATGGQLRSVSGEATIKIGIKK